MRRRHLALALAVVAVGGCGSTGGAGLGVRAELRPVVPRSPLGRLAGLPTGPQDDHVAWRRRLEGPVVPGPVEGPDGTIFAASNGGVLHAVDPADGHDRWTFDAHASYGVDLSTSPVLVRGTVLWPGPHDTLFALDARTGALRHEVALDGQPLTPAVDGDAVQVQTAAGTLVTLSAADLRVRSRVSVGSVSYSSPVVGRDGTVYTGADDDLVAVRRRRVVWRVRTRNTVEVSPAVTPDGTITIGSNDHHQYGVSPSGHVRWRYDLGDLTYSSAAVTRDGLVYVGDHRGLVSALDARTGRLRYRVLGMGRTKDLRDVGVWTRPVVDGRHDVYFGTRPGHVYGFGSDGRRLLVVDLGATVDSYPLLTAKGLLVVGSESGALTAFG